MKTTTRRLTTTRRKSAPIDLLHKHTKKVLKKTKKFVYSIVAHFGDQNVVTTSAPGNLTLLALKMFLKKKYKRIHRAIVTLRDYSITELVYSAPRSRKVAA
jgi:hypothetical protein